MITDLNQRWSERRDSYRPAGEPIRTAEFDVEEMRGEGSDSLARAFIETHHYSGAYPAARFRFGLYRRGELAGVAVFSHPCNDRTLTNVFGGRATDAVELGRFVLLDEVAGNGETWFLARAFELLRRMPAERRVRGVLSFSDPMERTNAQGVRVFGGHIGTIYQAHNAAFLGRSQSTGIYLLPDGTVLNNRALTKIRKGERGWRPAAQILVEHGAGALPENEEFARRAWLKHWLARLTRRVQHPGNLKYAWMLDRRSVCWLGLPYPKAFDVRGAVAA